MQTRSFDDSDIAAITDLFARVFTQSEGAAEGEMVSRLAADMMATTDKRDLHGFVATDDGRIVGAVLFSRLRFGTDIDAFILSPMAVDPDRQRAGVGSTLIRHGLGQLGNQGVELVVTYGDPTYYTRPRIRASVDGDAAGTVRAVTTGRLARADARWCRYTVTRGALPLCGCTRQSRLLVSRDAHTRHRA